MAAREVTRATCREDFEIAIVCTKDHEYNAVCLVLDGFWDDDGDPFGRAQGDPNTYTTATAAGTAASLRSSYPCIKLLLLTGTCDGVPNAAGEELLLGDVVVSDTVVQYDLGRRYPDGFREKDTLEDRLSRPGKNVRNLVTVLKTDIGLRRLEEKVSSYLRKMQSRASEEPYQRRSKATYQYLGPTNDMLFESTYCHKHYGSPQCICDDYTELGDRHKKKLQDDGDVESAQQPSIFIGRFGSGDTSFSAGIDRDRIAQKHNIIAFETEGAGIWDELPCIIVKGVSTYGDGHKVGDTEAWENFAAATAACAARGLISRYPQTDKSLVVESKNQMEIVFKSQADIACLRDLYITSPPNDKTRIEQTKGGLLLDAYATDSRLNSASSILRGLLHMLISKKPSLISYVRKEYDKSGKLIFEDSNSWVVLSQIFLSTLEDPSVTDLTFIIDALDECLGDLPNLLNRNEADIQEVLLHAKNQSIVSLELNAESVSAAIKTYIDHKVELLSGNKRYQQDMRDSVREYLANNADGTFLWVALVCEMLEKAPSFDRSLESARYPRGLDNLYERMIQKVCHSELDWGRRILSINTVARRPLSIQELETLTFYPESANIAVESLEKRWEEALGYCGNFLTQRKGVVYFIHQSAKDFILNKASYKLFCEGMEHVNNHIFKISISAIISTLKRDIYGLSKPGFLISDLTSQDIPSPDPLAPVGYCCVYWIDHLEESILLSGDSKGEELISTFLSKKYLYWLESLSLLQSMHQGQIGMRKLERLLINTESPRLKERIWDTRRFIQMFGKAIGDAPLQVYISALLFSPVESITRKQFSAEAPHWVRVWPDGYTNWTSCIQKFDGNSQASYDTLAISSCGTWLAAHHHPKITIWDVETGRIIRCIKHDSYQRDSFFIWFEFSPQNRNELVIITYDEKVLFVWDITTASTVRRIRLPDAKIHGLSFLPSAPYIIGIIMGDLDKNYYIAYLNTQKEEEVHKRPLFLNGTVMEAEFSPINGDILAIYINEGMGSQIIIYNIDTDDIIHSLAVYWASGIEFSPDGKYLAAFARLRHSDGILHLPEIILIDIMTGKTVWASEIQHCSLEVPTFSADGQLLGVVTRDTVQIWDIASGQCIQESGVEANCNIFSPNENKLFCSSHGSISVIEIGHRGMAPPRNTENHPQQVMISPDGRKSEVILTINSDSGIEIIKVNENLPAEEETNCGVDDLGFWITLNAERVIWLPPEYRPTMVWKDWHARNSCIAISNTSTPLSIFKFLSSVCPGQMVAQSGEKRKHTSSTPEKHKRSRTVNLDDGNFILRIDMTPLEGKTETYNDED
ncbi:hypothetical protein LI328DRAFT_164822 [Trichoderma asperelloides]|nr:hypothetical protein LI328DRAFT_164822 [Trichoderma asperelloides]